MTVLERAEEGYPTTWKARAKTFFLAEATDE
jgi:hypothetical protein